VHAIEHEAAVQRRARTHDALSKCPADAAVLCAVARVFWAEAKHAKARGWFERAVSGGDAGSVVRGGLGDVWIYYYKFEMEQLRRAREQTAAVEQRVRSMAQTAGGDEEAALAASEAVSQQREELARAEARVHALKLRCATAAPRYGERWCALSKRDRVSHRSEAGVSVVPWTTEEILEEGAARVEDILSK
jgi:hypothetical protein